MKRLFLAALATSSCLFPIASQASTPADYAYLDRVSATACIRASGLRNARAGEVTRFSDRTQVDVRIVTGVYPQSGARDDRTSMMCVYNRRTGRVEVQEMSATRPQQTENGVKDVWWRAIDIDGEAVLGPPPITILLGSDGKIVGRTSCNNYSVSYSMTGDAVRIYGPIAGTRMMCQPELMAQEERYTDVLQDVSSVVLGRDGYLIATTRDSMAIRFSRSDPASHD